MVNFKALPGKECNGFNEKRLMVLWSILVAFWLWYCMVKAYRYYTDQLVGKVWVHVMVNIMGSLVVRYFVLWEQKHSEGNHLQYFYQKILTGECKWSYLSRTHVCLVSIWFALWVMGMDWCRGNYLVIRTVRRVFATILQRFQYLVSSNQGLDQLFYVQHMRTNGLIFVGYEMEIWDDLWFVVGNYSYNRTIIKQMKKALGFLLNLRALTCTRGQKSHKKGLWRIWEQGINSSCGRFLGILLHRCDKDDYKYYYI